MTSRLLVPKAPASTPVRPVRSLLMAGLPLTLALLAGACRSTGGGGGGPVPESCANGTMEVVVKNELALRVRVLEQSPLNATRILGEIPGRDTRRYEIQNFAGMVYSVQVIDTGELIAAENMHPRGYISRGATIVRECN